MGISMAFRSRLRMVLRLWCAVLLASAAMCLGQTVTPPESTFFATAAEEAYSTYQLPGDGDLWPSCWADDDNLYAANGDGTAFTSSTSRYDMAVSVISGMPTALSGKTVATDVGTNFSGANYNRKPTGMLCIGGALYLAYQNLSKDFYDSPAASIAKSSDHGATWTWDSSAPMFGTPGDPGNALAHKFTTIFFLDYGKNSANAIDGYVYAYGLDNNWRSQQALYLARVPNDKVQTRSAWEFYTGRDGSGNPTWSGDITQKTAVLTDTRLLYPVKFATTNCPAAQPVIAQGGVTYDAPLHRYIFSSWACATHEFYEAPNPWGPWSHFLSDDFGSLKTPLNYGQYGTSIPSKFISADGKTLYVQSNIFDLAYTFALRRLYVQPYAPTSPANALSTANLALAPGTRAVSKSTHFGTLCGLSCSDLLNSGNASGSEDDFDEESKPVDWWGYTWPQSYNINQVVYETGTMFPDGGWYASNLRVQVRQNFQWVDVAGATVSPAYPYSNQAGSNTAYTFSFPAVVGDGVRIIGTPGGNSHFTSIAQLSVYYASAPVGKPDFSLSSSVNSIAVAAGQSGTAVISAIPENGFSQTISFACSGLPSLTACSFSPATVTLGGNAAATTTVTISTTAATTSKNVVPWRLAWGGSALALCLFFPRKNGRLLYRAGLGLTSLFLMMVSGMALGCNGGKSSSPPVTNPGTPAGTSTVTVTATAGSGASTVSHTTTLTLTVR